MTAGGTVGVDHHYQVVVAIYKLLLQLFDSDFEAIFSAQLKAIDLTTKNLFTDMKVLAIGWIE